MTNPEETAAPAHSRRGFVVGILLCVVATAFEAMAVLTAMRAAAKGLGGLVYYAWACTGTRWMHRPTRHAMAQNCPAQAVTLTTQTTAILPWTT